MSGRVGRWRVPYSAPGSLGGSVTVTATSREDAYTKAIAIHRKQKTLRGSAAGSKAIILRLTTAQRLHIEYGEPELIETAEDRAATDLASRLAGGAA